jgi:hypothetical protein
MTYRFPYFRYLRVDTSNPLHRFKNEPLLDIALLNNKSNKSVKVVAYIDTGSQWCLFNKQYAFLK